MGLCDNEELKYSAGVPEDVKKLRERLIALIQGNVTTGTGATPYNKPTVAGPDPMQLAANNTIMKMMGYGGYTFPGFPPGGGGVPYKPGGKKPPEDLPPPPDLPPPDVPRPPGLDWPTVRTSGPSGIQQRSGGLDPYSPQGRLLAAMLNQRSGQ